MPHRPVDREGVFLARFASPVTHRWAMHGRPVLASVVAASSIALLAAGIWSVRRSWHPASGTGEPANSAAPSIVHLDPVLPAKPPVAPLTGLDLSRMASDASGPIAPTEAGTAHLTLDAELQRTALGLMSAHHLPEGAVVVMDVATGKLLAYASHVDKGPPRDLCAEASAPSASVFKIVTAAALVEDAHLGRDTRQCYSGGESRINAIDLVDDPQRDRWCTTLGGAMGRSINTVFARLASEHLAPPQLEAMARRFGYGQGVPFDVPVQASALRMPSEPLEFARTAAGFWNTTMSPMQAVEMSAIVARGGESIRPGIVETVASSTGAVLWSAPEEPSTRRVITREAADEVAAMMAHTVGEGTSWRAFHDPHGAAFLPGIEVAGKTGTLTDGEAHRYYTWFTGFAPAHPAPPARQIAIAALVVNGPTWQLKANVIAREVLRAYFAAQGSEGVTRPSLAEVARTKKTPR
jgi:peptidoglycan glycosyltransferase